MQMGLVMSLPGRVCSFVPLLLSLVGLYAVLRCRSRRAEGPICVSGAGAAHGKLHPGILRTSLQEVAGDGLGQGWLRCPSQ